MIWFRHQICWRFKADKPKPSFKALFLALDLWRHLVGALFFSSNSKRFTSFSCFSTQRGLNCEIFPSVKDIFTCGQNPTVARWTPEMIMEHRPVTNQMHRFCSFCNCPFNMSRSTSMFLLFWINQFVIKQQLNIFLCVKTATNKGVLQSLQFNALSSMLGLTDQQTFFWTWASCWQRRQ